jgi:hypothetical protein
MEAGIPIMPIYCLFLSQQMILCTRTRRFTLLWTLEGGVHGTGTKSEDYEKRAIITGR